MFTRNFTASLAIVGVLLTFTQPACSYTLPLSKSDMPANPQLIELQKISEGVSAIAKEASQAVVFVSVTKNLAGAPPGMLDPFDFFFGPPGRGPHGPRGPRAPLPQPRQQGVGSGFFVDLDKGYIVTNNHVIEGADEIELKLADGQLGKAKIIGRDPNTDIAVIQLRKFKKEGLTELLFGDSAKLEAGDFVVALGAPFGLEASMSFGVISAVGRGGLGIAQLGDFIQTDAAINPGNSGGPLLDTSALVIGVNTAIYSQTGVYNGVGFAVPSNLARLVAERLINDGKMTRGYIGAALQPLDNGLAASLRLPKNVKGSVVTHVQPDGPAARAGLKPGDVIAEVDDKPLTNTSELVNTLGLMAPGQQIKLTVYRDGKEQTIPLKLGEWPAPEMSH